ncbi:MAG: TetR family transcriptional regulator [Firmicutes bacterium]|nr:TetR family transcriptional regulator [Bacillota bacterium]
MQRKSSREILAESFRELAQSRPADRITVQEITQNCGYSPATFYRQFRDKYDLIAWDYSAHCSAIMDNAGADGKTWEAVMREGCDYLCSQRKYIENLLQNTGGQDSFFRYMSLVNAQLVTQAVTAKRGEETLSKELTVCIKVFAYGIAQLLCEFLAEPQTLSDADLPGYLCKALPEPLVPYLLT